MPVVTDMDLARQLCEAAHPFLRTTGAIVPCVGHRQEGARLLVLTKPEGAGVLAVLLQHRAASEAPAEHAFGGWSPWAVGGVGAAAVWTRTRACHCGHVAAEVVDAEPAADDVRPCEMCAQAEWASGEDLDRHVAESVPNLAHRYRLVGDPPGVVRPLIVTVASPEPAAV